MADPYPRDGRKVDVVVHHVASMYPLEIQLARLLAEGKPVVGVSNSGAAAALIRTLTDEELDQAAPVSLNSDAPLTCQFMLEDHAVRHSYHHLARAALGRTR